MCSDQRRFGQGRAGQDRFTKWGAMAMPEISTDWKVLVIKPTSCINSLIYFWNKTLHVSDSSSVHHQEFFTVNKAIHTSFADSLRAGSGLPTWSCSQGVWHILLLCVQLQTPDDGQRNCPKHVEFYSKNKFDKLVHLVGFIIRIHHDARPPKRQFVTMHGHLNVNLLRCTVTWTSHCHDARSPEHHFVTKHGHLNVNLSRCTVTWTSICHDARSPERQFVTMHGHLNITLSRCTVTWTSICHDARSPEHRFVTMHGHLNVNLSRCTVTWTSICHDARSPERHIR